MGLSPVPDRSGLSSSRYVTFYNDDSSWKIRISDHALPPSYGQSQGWPDFDLGDHPDSSGNYYDCLRWISRVSEVALPVAYRTAVTTDLNRVKARHEEARALSENSDQQEARRKELIRELVSSNPEFRQDVLDMASRPGKRAIAEARHEIEDRYGTDLRDLTSFVIGLVKAHEGAVS